MSAIDIAAAVAAAPMTTTTHMLDPVGNILWRLNYRTPVVTRSGEEEKCSILVRSPDPEGRGIGSTCWKVDKVVPILKHTMDENTEVFAYDQTVSEQVRVMNRMTADYTELCYTQRNLTSLEEELGLKVEQIEHARVKVIELFELLHGFSMPARYLKPSMTVQLACTIPEFKINRPKPEDEVRMSYFLIHWQNIPGWKYYQELVLSDSEESIRACIKLYPPLQDEYNRLPPNYDIVPLMWYGPQSCPIELAPIAPIASIAPIAPVVPILPEGLPISPIPTSLEEKKT